MIFDSHVSAGAFNEIFRAFSRKMKLFRYFNSDFSHCLIYLYLHLENVSSHFLVMLDYTVKFPQTPMGVTESVYLRGAST